MPYQTQKYRGENEIKLKASLAHHLPTLFADFQSLFNKSLWSRLMHNIKMCLFDNDKW